MRYVLFAGAQGCTLEQRNRSAPGPSAADLPLDAVLSDDGARSYPEPPGGPPGEEGFKGCVTEECFAVEC